MNPVSESPSLPSSLAIVASLVLVCGGLLLLTSTAPWTSRPDAASDAASPARVAVAPPANNRSSPAREETAEADRGDMTQAAEAQPQQAAPEPAETNRFASSFAQAEGSVAASGVAQIEAPDEAANEPGVDATEASAADVSADVSEVDAPEQVDAAGAEAAAAEAIAAEAMSGSQPEPMPENALAPGPEIKTASAGTEPAKTPPAAETGAAATDQIGAVLSESPPQTIATETVAEHDNESVTPSPEPTSAEKT